MSKVAAVVAQGIECVFPRAELDARINAARKELIKREIDVMIVTGPENIFYLTGQQSPGYYTYMALLLPVEGEPVFIVRLLELNNLVANSYVSNIEPYTDDSDPVDVTVALITQLGWQNKRIGIDERGWFLPIAIYNALRAKLGTIKDAARVVETLRVVKSETEIKKIEIAATYVEAGMRAGMATVAAGATENDLVSEMMGKAIRAGSEYVGMEPLVSSGPRSGIPHGTWRRRRLEAGDATLLEMAACHDRYHAALMRTAWVGKAPDQARRMMDCCIEALAAALAALKPGATCEDVHMACQKVIDKAGYTDSFRKRTGYSIGISFAPDWGEGNVLSLFTGIRTVIQPGMVFHMPPALRVYGKFTVGVSETAIVTVNGCRPLSRVSRELLEV
ncbi:M24 family metallopeptidase [Shumkonia mesophila]|uniref:M24 family metallopeptidase n=1 Tax=Shumkonia mesophila TaxID=2838854 RepID=UPI002934235B|nr:Xaa-Pro peptidase family protein [Shumkonia mesophila]